MAEERRDSRRRRFNRFRKETLSASDSSSGVSSDSDSGPEHEYTTCYGPTDTCLSVKWSSVTHLSTHWSLIYNCLAQTLIQTLTPVQILSQVFPVLAHAQSVTQAHVQTHPVLIGNLTMILIEGLTWPLKEILVQKHSCVDLNKDGEFKL